MGGAGLTIYIQLYNSIFFFVFASVLYAVVSRAIPASTSARKAVIRRRPPQNPPITTAPGMHR